MAPGSDVRDDLTAAAKVRDALEALKPALITAWDDDDAVLVEGIDAFDGWFGLKELEAACNNGEVREAGRGVLGAGGAWQMARVGVKDEPITYDDVKGVLDASQTVVLNSLDATCSRVAALSLASIDAFGLPVCTNAYATGAGAATSAPPHTDKQRVLVFQCFGRSTGGCGGRLINQSGRRRTRSRAARARTSSALMNSMTSPS